MAIYFSNCETIGDLKKVYKTLAKKLHPDNGGNAEDFKNMQSEFSDLFSKLKNTHRNSKGEKYTKKEEDHHSESAYEFMGIIDKIITFEGVQIEVIGSWLWVSGNTKPYKDILKSLGFGFSGKKSSWYYHNEPFRKRSTHNLTMDDLREMWGSEIVSNGRPKSSRFMLDLQP